MKKVSNAQVFFTISGLSFKYHSQNSSLNRTILKNIAVLGPVCNEIILFERFRVFVSL